MFRPDPGTARVGNTPLPFRFFQREYPTVLQSSLSLSYSGAPMNSRRMFSLIVVTMMCFGMLACAKGPQDRKIEFVYLALGASDATGVGALPLTEGYVYLVKAELDRRMPGVFLLNLGIPGARIDLIKEQVRLAIQARYKANVVTLWTGGNDLVHGDDPKRFQEDLRFILQHVKKDISNTIVIANLPDLTQLPRFRQNPNPVVTVERVRQFNQAIATEARAIDAPMVDLFAQPVRQDLVFDVDGFHPNDAGHREIARLFLEKALPLIGAK
jgi:lysophospholipase L1-like esterase